jgi:uncharacterized membrane protein YidH (DUF202 family)
MKHRCMLWAGHLFLFTILADGIQWLTQSIRSLSSFGLFIALAAMTILVFNHFRWWTLSKKVDEKEIADKIDVLIVTNYCIFVLALILMSYHG